MKDASVVTKDTLITVAAQVQTEAADTNLIQSIAEREPLLAAFIADKLLAISGKLSLCGAPLEIVQGSYEDVASLVATSVRAVWTGTDELWRGIALEHITRSAMLPAAGSEGASDGSVVHKANESVIADQNTSVVEGNCRLAAYRMLASGKAAPRRRARRRRSDSPGRPSRPPEF